MAQVFWKYQNKEGDTFDVNLYHGEESRHVIIYSGHEIISIDFNIISAKTYSFMLNHELFELGIDFIDKVPNYILKNMETGRMIPVYSMSAMRKKHRLISIIILIIALILIFSMILIM